MSAIPIVALDVDTSAEALRLTRLLGDRCRFYKVGLELFTACGPDIVRALQEQGLEVFLDLKLHDIPNTVRGAARVASQLGASLLTVHASGGEAMVRAAVEGATEGSRPDDSGTGARRGCRILGVTILTSLDRGGVAQAWGREADGIEMGGEVVRLAEVVARGGGHGIVCSGHEVGRVRARFGDLLAPLVPGIRFEAGAVHDQARVMGPASAARAGARYVVLGRAVTGSADPAGAMERVWEELRGVSAADER